MRENVVFFTPVKYTLACHAPPVVWAARHTTMCLDLDNETVMITIIPIKLILIIDYLNYRTQHYH